MLEEEISNLREKIENDLKKVKQLKKEYKDAVRATNRAYQEMKDCEEIFSFFKNEYVVIYERKKSENKDFGLAWRNYEVVRYEVNNKIKKLNKQYNREAAEKKRYYDLVTKYTVEPNPDARKKCLENARFHRDNAIKLAEEMNILREEIRKAKVEAEATVGDDDLDLREARVNMVNAKSKYTRSKEIFDDEKSYRNDLKASIDELNSNHQADINTLWKLLMRTI